MKTAAKRALEWRREYKRGGTAVGVARARDIMNGKELSDTTVKRMYSFFSRHSNNKAKHYAAKESDGGPTAFRIAWDLWGGSGGFTWSKSIVSSMDKDRSENIDLNNTDYELESYKSENTIEDTHMERHVVSVEETEETYVIEFAKHELESESDQPEERAEVLEASEDQDRSNDPEVVQRSHFLDARALDDDKRTVKMSISSATSWGILSQETLLLYFRLKSGASTVPLSSSLNTL